MVGGRKFFYQRAFGDIERFQAGGVPGPPELGDLGADGTAILRVGQALDEAVRLESVDELSNVGLHARDTLGQLSEWERLPGLGEVPEGTHFGKRQPGRRERRLQPRLDFGGDVEHGRKQLVGFVHAGSLQDRVGGVNDITAL